jgi:hypothetical protein
MIRLVSILVVVAFSFSFARSQDRVGLYFETQPFGSYYSDQTERARTALQLGIHFREITLVQVVSIPSFSPVWSVRIYHPMRARPIVTLGEADTLYETDTLRYVIDCAKAKGSLSQVSSKSAHWPGWARGSVHFSRTIPDSLATFVTASFLSALQLTRWANSTDLLSIDGTEIHFAAYDRHYHVLLVAQSILNENTIASDLEHLSSILWKYASLKSDSLAASLESEIRRQARSLLDKCSLINDPHDRGDIHN